MGRHSRGAGEAPAPLPEPPTRHPYAPRSVEDTGDRDRRTYVGPPPGAALPPTPVEGPSPAQPAGYDDKPPLPRRRHGATRADLSGAPSRHPAPQPQRPRDPRGLPAPDAPALGRSRFGAPDLAGSRLGGAGADRGERFGATRPDPAEPRFGGSADDAAETRFGAARADPGGQRSGGGRRADGGEPRFGATRADPAETRLGVSADQTESRFGGRRADGGEPRFGATRADPAETRLGVSAAYRFGDAPADVAGSRFGLGESRLAAPPAEPVGPALAPVRADLGDRRFGATRADLAEPPAGRREEPAETRFGATRADLAESVGSTALAPLRATAPAPRRAPDPDEVSDTGARRARSAFRLAPETTETAETALHDDDDEEDAPEPALILQWAIFVAQTLTGAIAGLGVWLGFYRLWSTWPFYAVPAVGVAAVGMLVLARALRRRHGRDLDLLTAVVTAGIITVLTVLPAAFTLQGLMQ
jgi:hypothetical protein